MGRPVGIPLAWLQFTCSSRLDRSTLLILDSAGRIIAVLVGRPSDDESWEKTHLDAAQLIEQARGSCKFSATEKRHRRGHFPALAVGISHGGGQLRPGNRVNDKVNARVLASLIAQPSFIRMAGFASGTSIRSPSAPSRTYLRRGIRHLGPQALPVLLDPT